MLLTSSVPTLLKRAGVVCLLVAGAQFGFARCPGMDSDSHFQKLDETSMVRVFTLQLERLESTAKHCHEHAFFYVVTSDSETNDTLEDMRALVANGGREQPGLFKIPKRT